MTTNTMTGMMTMRMPKMKMNKLFVVVLVATLGGNAQAATLAEMRAQQQQLERDIKAAEKALSDPKPISVTANASVDDIVYALSEVPDYVITDSNRHMTTIAAECSAFASSVACTIAPGRDIRIEIEVLHMTRGSVTVVRGTLRRCSKGLMGARSCTKPLAIAETNDFLRELGASAEGVGLDH